MRISDKLSEAAAFNPTKQSQIKSVQDMCQDIEKGKITLPLYQRDLSWKLGKAVSLLNYQLFGKAPVAPISMNRIGKSNVIPQITFINRQRIDSSQNLDGNLSIVDGQQRLTTNYKAYIDHPTFKDIVLDVTQAKFRIIKHAPRPNQIPVGILLNKDQHKLRDYLQNEGQVGELYPVLLEVRSKMTTYNYTVHIANDLDEDEQIEWFDVLNTAGSRVTGIQLAFSKIKLHDFDIYASYINPYKEKLADAGLDNLFTPFTTKVSYPIVSLNPAYEVVFNNGVHKNNYAPTPSDARQNSLVKLDKKQLEHLAKITLDALQEALDLIYDNGLTSYITKVNYVMYLTGYFVFHTTPISESSKEKLIDWIKSVNFKNKKNSERRQIYSNLLKL